MENRKRYSRFVCYTRPNQRGLLSAVRFDKVFSEPVPSVRMVTLTMLTRSLHPILAIPENLQAMNSFGAQTSSHSHKLNRVHCGTVHMIFQLQSNIRITPQVSQSRA